MIHLWPLLFNVSYAKHINYVNINVLIEFVFNLIELWVFIQSRVSFVISPNGIRALTLDWSKDWSNFILKISIFIYFNHLAFKKSFFTLLKY